MKLINIKIENFGIYENSHEIPFIGLNNNKLTLIIGRNGAGKTTMLNAIKTAFYGPLVLKVKSITPDYRDFIATQLNKHALANSKNKFTISIEFISNILEADGRYTIERSWQLQDEKLSEMVIVHRNSKLLSPDQSDEFLNTLYRNYPIELFDLFFFDGERIDQLSILNQDIVSVLETAFNLNLYKALKSDLEKYILNKSKNSELSKLELRKEAILSSIEQAHIEEHATIQQLNELKKELATKQQQVEQIKKSGFRPIDELASGQLKQQQKELEDLNKTLKHELIEIIPYTTLKQEINALMKQLKNENTAKKYEVISKEIGKLDAEEIGRSIRLDNSEVVSQVLNYITSKYDSKSNVEKLHDLSIEQFNEIRQFHSKFERYSFESFKAIKKEIDQKRIQLEESKATLIGLQSQDYQDNLTSILMLQSKIDAINFQISSIQERIEQMATTLTKSQNELQQIESQIWKQIKTINIDQIVVKTNTVLEKYIEKINKSKIESIQSETLAMFNHIIRKENFIKHIELNNQSIKFKDHRGKTFGHQHLSAGERQLFTLSLLVSILKTTQRITPLVFDTLLSRLDQNHKERLLEELLINAPEQIIILATDSEIDDYLLTFLEPWINQKIIIDLSSSTNKIMIEGVS